MTAPRLVVLGWDSATFDVADPLMEQGRLPALRSVTEKGFRAPLRSTWPPMTDCAWTSAFTGRNAGGHGIIGSWYRSPGAYECRYFSSRDRGAPPVWEMTGAPGLGAGGTSSAAGAAGAREKSSGAPRWLVWNVPMTFPPTPLEGAMVAGYGAPPGSRFTIPAGLQDAVARRWSLGDLLDLAPHGSLERFFRDLLRGLEIQPSALKWAAEDAGADCVVAVWPHIDRAQHFFWQFRGTGHPLAGAVDDTYEAMDRATGVLMEAWPDADFVIVSDHGAGPLLGDINMGAWLAAAGHAVHADGAKGAGPARGSARRRMMPGLAGIAWGLPSPLRRLARRVAPNLARATLGATLSGQLAAFDWDHTRAFMGVHGDLWLNLAGREPRGIVAEEDAGEVLSEIAAAVLEIEDPATGNKVFAGAHRRAEIYSGPFSDLAPDLMLDSWTQGYRVAPGRGPSTEVVVAPEALSGVDEAWSADHRPLGIFAAAGSRIAHGRAAELSLYDVCPTMLALLEQPIPEGLDGRCATEALQPNWLASHPLTGAAELHPTTPEGGAYSPDEAAAVAAHLKDLGYID